MGRGREVDHPHKETFLNNDKGERVRKNIVGRHKNYHSLLHFLKEFMSTHPIVLYPAVLTSLAHSYLNQ